MKKKILVIDGEEPLKKSLVLALEESGYTVLTPGRCDEAMVDLGTMASGIGHQANNHFNVIKLGAESALMLELARLKEYFEENDSESGRKWVAGLSDTCKKIAKNAEDGGEVVKGLLDFSRRADEFKVVDVKKTIRRSARS